MVSLVESEERGKLPSLMNTNRESEIDYSDYNSGLYPPPATQDRPSAGLCRLLLFASHQLVGRSFEAKTSGCLQGWEGPGPIGICVSGRDAQKGSGSASLTFAWRWAASPICLFSSPFRSSPSALPHHDLIFRLFPSFCILFLLVFFP